MRKYFRFTDFLMSAYELLVIYNILLSYKLIFGSLGWEYLFRRCQLITNNSTIKRLETLSKCFQRNRPEPHPQSVKYNLQSLSQYFEVLM